MHSNCAKYVKKPKNAQHSESRNPNLANIFYRLKYVESFGTGIGRIIESYNEFDKKTVFVDTDNAFNVTLYNVNYLEKNENVLPPQEEKIAVKKVVDNYNIRTRFKNNLDTLIRE